MKNRLLFFYILTFVSCSRNETIRPTRQNIIETVYASGKIIPENEYRVFALSNGIVREKRVLEGDSIPGGSPIYIIESDAQSARLDAARSQRRVAEENLAPGSRVLTELRLALDNAAAKLRNDSLNYARLAVLYEQNATSKSSLDNAFTAYTVSQNLKHAAEERYHATQNELNVALQNARSAEAAAQADLDNYTIKSDAPGTVFQLLKEPGEVVRAGEMVALLGATSRRIIRMSVDQQDIDKLKPGQEVLLKTDVSGSTIFHGTVSRLYPAMNEIDQTFRVDAVFNEPFRLPFIHSSVEANILIQQKKNALIIPRTAMVADDSVIVKSDGEEKTRFVKTGIRTLDDVEILDGLNENSTLVIPGKK